MAGCSSSAIEVVEQPIDDVFVEKAMGED